MSTIINQPTKITKQMNESNIHSPLVKGETQEDWEKLKEYKISTDRFYTGPFATARGNPNFGIVPMIGKIIFLVYSIYYVVTKNYKYSIYALIFYTIGSILNGIRFYYVNSLSTEGEDSKFLTSVFYDNLAGAIIGLLAIAYILLKKK